MAEFVEEERKRDEALAKQVLRSNGDGLSFPPRELATVTRRGE